MTEYERCIDCDRITGNSGFGEDSLFIYEDGPYCEECWIFHEGNRKKERHLISKLHPSPSSDVTITLTKEEAELLHKLTVRGTKK